jgi:integrase
MAIMGWSSAAVATQYQHVLDCNRKDVAKQVGGLLWKPAADQADDEDDGNDGTSGTLVPA